jgi:hypothetical protein
MILFDIYMDYGFFDNGYQLNKHTATEQPYQSGLFTFTPAAIEQNIRTLNLALHPTLPWRLHRLCPSGTT